MRALVYVGSFVVAVSVALLLIVGFDMAQGSAGDGDAGNPAGNANPAAVNPVSADEARKNIPGYHPTREDRGLPPPEPCEACKKKHRK